MKKSLLLLLLFAILISGCSADTGQNDINSSTADLSGTQNRLSDDKNNSSGEIGGEIDFYPTYDTDYKTVNNEVFDFWFDVPNSWKAVDQSEDGSVFTILSDKDNIEIKIYGVLIDGTEEDFYTSLLGDNGKITDFTYRDGWVGKQINPNSDETYFVRIDGDSFIVFYVNSNGDTEWINQNAEKLNCMAISVRTTRESYGNTFEDKNTITLEDLQLGQMRINMSYDELLKVMKQEPEREVEEEYGGADAKTLFFADNTQIYVIDNSIYCINVTSPDYLTPRGLKIGDSVDKLLELYGEPSNKEGERWGYTYQGYELFTVVIEKEKVVEIQIAVAM